MRRHPRKGSDGGIDTTEIFSDLIAAGHTFHDLMWVYPTELVYRFHEHVKLKEQRDTARYANLLQLVGYTAREVDKKGNQSINGAWKRLHSGFAEAQKVLRRNPQTGAAGTGKVAAKVAEKTREAMKEDKFIEPDNKPKIRTHHLDTGNSAANIFMNVGLPVSF